MIGSILLKYHSIILMYIQFNLRWLFADNWKAKILSWKWEIALEGQGLLEIRIH